MFSEDLTDADFIRESQSIVLIKEIFKEVIFNVPKLMERGFIFMPEMVRADGAQVTSAEKFPRTATVCRDAFHQFFTGIGDFDDVCAVAGQNAFCVPYLQQLFNIEGLHLGRRGCADFPSTYSFMNMYPQEQWKDLSATPFEGSMGTTRAEGVIQRGFFFSKPHIEEAGATSTSCLLGGALKIWLASLNDSRHFTDRFELDCTDIPSVLRVLQSTNLMRNNRICIGIQNVGDVMMMPTQIAHCVVTIPTFWARDGTTILVGTIYHLHSVAGGERGPEFVNR